MRRTLVRGTVVVILLTVVVSGPLVPWVDFTTPRGGSVSPFCEASGNATVDVVSPPSETIELSKQRFGAGLYELSQADATVEVSSVRGCPILVYELTVHEMDMLNRRLFWLNNRSADLVTLDPVSVHFSPERVSSGPLNGTITIRLRGEQNRTILRRNVSITAAEDQA